VARIRTKKTWQGWCSPCVCTSVYQSKGLRPSWPVLLQKGDEVQCEIEELGVIINKVV
jgi:2-keto-4-pentenoate hydratase/2-oxohepta-3-ene-1,7-dioic acid hydratase in catechol pathway